MDDQIQRIKADWTNGNLAIAYTHELDQSMRQSLAEKQLLSTSKQMRGKLITKLKKSFKKKKKN